MMPTRLDPEAIATLRKRQHAFERCLDDHFHLLQRTQNLEHRWFAPPRRAVCPCCGYPALTVRVTKKSNIGPRTCFICGWRDNGGSGHPADQEDAYFHYSLAEAQVNFVRFGQTYHPSDTLRFEDLERSKHIREQIIRCFEALLPNVDLITSIETIPDIRDLYTRRYEARKLSVGARAALQVRRKAFEECLDIVRDREAVKQPTRSASFAVCPCCGYPTLAERNAYDICVVCGWEDDGQDDAPSEHRSADIVAGGPNFDYSLTEARCNFLEYRQQYRPSDEHRFQRYARSIEVREQIIAIFEAMLPKPDPTQYLSALPILIELHKRRHHGP